MSNTPLINSIPQWELSTGLPASGYWMKAYQAGAVSTAVTTYTSLADGTGGTKFQLNSLGQPASGGTAFAPHYQESVDIWLFPTSAAADANDTSAAIQVVDASVVNPYDVIGETVQKVASSVGSAADAITAALSTVPTLTDPLQVRVEISHGANTTTTPTFDLNSLGAKTIVRDGQVALVAGDTGGSGAVLDLAWSETNDTWVLLNPAGVAASVGGNGLANTAGVLSVNVDNSTIEINADTLRVKAQGIGEAKLGYVPLNVKSGLDVSVNGSNPTTDLDISAGEIGDSTKNYMLAMAAARLKRVDATYAVSTNATRAGGFSNQSTLGTSTWHQVFLISKSTDITDCDVIIATTQANALADTVAAAAGFDLARRIGYVYVNGSAQIVKFIAAGHNTYDWDVMVSETISAATSRTAVTSQCPPSQVARVQYALDVSNTGAITFGKLTQISQTDTAPSSSAFDIAGINITTSADPSSTSINIKTDSSSQFYHRESSTTGVTPYLFTRGWVDDLSVWS